jgi:hypothetical protein
MSVAYTDSILRPLEHCYRTFKFRTEHAQFAHFLALAVKRSCYDIIPHASLTAWLNGDLENLYV